MNKKPPLSENEEFRALDRILGALFRGALVAKKAGVPQATVVLDVDDLLLLFDHVMEQRASYYAKPGRPKDAEQEKRHTAAAIWVLKELAADPTGAVEKRLKGEAAERFALKDSEISKAVTKRRNYIAMLRLGFSADTGQDIELTEDMDDPEIIAMTEAWDKRFGPEP